MMKSDYRKFKKIFVKQNEIECFTEKLSSIPFRIEERKVNPGDCIFPNVVYVWKTSTNIHVVSKFIYNEGFAEYIINDRGKDKIDLDVGDMYKFFRSKWEKGFKLEELANDEIYRHFTSTAIMFKRDEYEGKKVQAFGYDMNKCYLAAMKYDMPDTRFMRVWSRVDPGYIGFNLTNEKVLHTFENGEQEIRFALKIAKNGQLAEFVFPLIKSPFLNYANYMEKQIKRAKEEKNKDEESRLKAAIVCSVGNLQNHNPFMRAAIVEQANEKIRDLIDDDTIYANTDCIISLKERKDIKISDNVGDFKLENKGSFVFTGFNYEWENGKKSKRGKTDDPIKWMYKIQNGKLSIVEC